jgi:putative ABC transport system permease protein
VLLAFAGGGLGLLTSVWVLQVAKKLTPAEDILTQGIKIDARVLVFTFVVAVLTGIISGLAPAWQSLQLDLTDALKDSVGSHPGFIVGSGHRLRSLLGVLETAAALVLLIGAGLLIRSFGKLLAVKPGFRTNGLVAAKISLLEPRYKADEGRLAFTRELLPRVQALPGVRDAAFANVLPFGQGAGVMLGLNFGHGPKLDWAAGDGAYYLVVSEGYFHTMGIPLLAGRSFTEGDAKGSAPVAIVSQSLARHGWPGQNPLGRQFSLVGGGKHSFEVVGVVGDVRAWDLGEQPLPTMYVPILQHPLDAAFLVIHGTESSHAIETSLPGVVRSVDKNEPISSIGTMEQLIAQSVAAPRFRTLLLGIFAGLAFLLAVVGIYGIISYSVSQRAHEIGIRMALGAERREVMELVLGQGLRVALIGVGIGIVAALALGRLLANYLYTVRPTDPLTLVVVTASVIAVALLASYIPARRATKVDPMVALRYE